jgi:ABC-type transporter Mla maintaining outer membrane lipid asymmetry permease subunit MlaE
MTNRTITTDSRSHLYTVFPKNTEQLRTNVWLSDPGAYPIIAVLSFTVGFAGYFMIYNVFRNPDVRILASRRKELIHTWEH